MVGGVWEIALPGCPYTHKLDTSISPIFLKIYFCKYLVYLPVQKVSDLQAEVE